MLDEATSALDSESEILVQEALWHLMRDRTALVVAHRLSTVVRMDRLVVLDRGHVLEQGTHRELLQSEGPYARLWHHQSGGFLTDEHRPHGRTLRNDTHQRASIAESMAESMAEPMAQEPAESLTTQETARSPGH